MINSEILVAFGGSVKALGSSKFAGPAVVFGDAMKTDVSAFRDYMDGGTDFMVDDDEWGQFTVPLIYNHGLDPALKRTRLGSVTYTKTAANVWAEIQLKLRKDYEAKFGEHLERIEEMVERKALGLSTGVPGHLVEREKRGEANYLKSWPLRISELSLTPTPAEPRTTVLALKSLMTEDPGSSAPGESFVDTCLRTASELEQAAKRFEKIGPAKVDAIKSLRDALDGLIRPAAKRPDPDAIRAASVRVNALLAKLGSRP